MNNQITHPDIDQVPRPQNTISVDVQRQPNLIDNPEVYLADKAGSIGVWIALFFGFIRYIDLKGMLADWRPGQKALTKLADDVADIARSIETQNSRYVDDVHRLETSLNRIQTKLDQMVDR